MLCMIIFRYFISIPLRLVAQLTVKLRISHECSCFIELLNKLKKRGKMRGLPSILSLFRNEFNNFNNTRARMLDSIYHMTLRLL